MKYFCHLVSSWPSRFQPVSKFGPFFTSFLFPRVHTDCHGQIKKIRGRSKLPFDHHFHLLMASTWSEVSTHYRMLECTSQAKREGEREQSATKAEVQCHTWPFFLCTQRLNVLESRVSKCVVTVCMNGRGDRANHVYLLPWLLIHLAICHWNTNELSSCDLKPSAFDTDLEAFIVHLPIILPDRVKVHGAFRAECTFARKKEEGRRKE